VPDGKQGSIEQPTDMGCQLPIMGIMHAHPPRYVDYRDGLDHCQFDLGCRTVVYCGSSGHYCLRAIWAWLYGG
jgi:hypothetical protein